MNCQKCNAILTEKDEFCRFCGEPAKNNHIDQYKYSYNYSNKEKPNYNMNADHQEQYTYNYNYSNDTKPNYNMYSSHQEQYDYNYNYSNYESNGDDKYVKEYIGPNYKEIAKERFSIPAFFFNGYYLLYRKQWLYAILYIILTNATSQLLSENLKFITNIVINIYIGFKFNTLYLNNARKKVEKIKNENLDKTTQELIDICRKKGGVSIKIILVGMILIPIITSIIIATGSIIDSTTKTTEENKDSTYYIKFDDLTFTAPSDFKKQFISTNTVDLKYYPKETTYSCNITVASYKLQNNNITEKEFIIDKIHQNHPNYITPDETQPILLNNAVWQHQKITTPEKESTYYAINYNNNIYYIYTSNNDQNKAICNNKYTEFLNTIKLKEL